MPVRPTLLHRIALVSFLLFRKNLGNLGEFFGQTVQRPPTPWQKIARTPMVYKDPTPNTMKDLKRRLRQGQKKIPLSTR